MAESIRIEQLVAECGKIKAEMADLDTKFRAISKELQSICPHTSIGWGAWRRIDDYYNPVSRFLRDGNCSCCGKWFEQESK